MKRQRHSLKKASILISILVVLYVILSSGYHKYEIDGIIKNSKPEDVWGFVADFSKMKLLNPTMYVKQDIC